MRILEIADLSTPRVKRYSAVVITSTGDEAAIRQMVLEATEAVKTAEVYRNEATKERWTGKPAQVVWLYVAKSEEDAGNARWVCRTQWIDPNLNEHRPIEMEGHERHGDLIIRWIGVQP